LALFCILIGDLVVERGESARDREQPMTSTRDSARTEYAPTRRAALALGAGAVAAFTVRPARAEEVERHGISTFGDLKYPADFKHFDYANVDAPKGGIFSQLGTDRQFNQNFLTFNSLNAYILKGDAAQGMKLTFAASPPRTWLSRSTS